MTKRNMIAPGCYFEPEEETIETPIMGKRVGGFRPNEPAIFRRHSELDDIPDNFLERMRARRGEIQHSAPVREVDCLQQVWLSINSKRRFEKVT